MNLDWFRERGVGPALPPSPREVDVLRGHLLRLLTETSLPHLLRYEDRNSMAFSVESRVPFLTPRLVNLLLSLPEEYLIGPDGTSKRVFPEPMLGIVPEARRVRKDKVGFATPERRWLADLRPWVGERLRGGVLRRIPAVDWAEAEREWRAVEEGRRPFGFRVWRWLNLAEWVRRFDVAVD